MIAYCTQTRAHTHTLTSQHTHTYSSSMKKPQQQAPSHDVRASYVKWRYWRNKMNITGFDRRMMQPKEAVKCFRVSQTDIENNLQLRLTDTASLQRTPRWSNSCLKSEKKNFDDSIIDFGKTSRHDNSQLSLSLCINANNQFSLWRKNVMTAVWRLTDVQTNQTIILHE